jgi:hypothetical protein
MTFVDKILMCFVIVANCTGCALKDSTPSSSQLGNGKDSGTRNMYSPDVYGDPAAQQQWIAAIEALEEQCRTTGKYCLEAAGARKSLRDNVSGQNRPAL